MMLARVAGFEADQEVDFVGTGIDHNSWFTRLSVGPEDVLERLRQQGFHRADGMLPTEVVSVDPMAENSSNRDVLFSMIGWAVSAGRLQPGARATRAATGTTSHGVRGVHFTAPRLAVWTGIPSSGRLASR